MRTHGRFCPGAKAAELFCGRWSALVVRDLAWGSGQQTPTPAREAVS